MTSYQPAHPCILPSSGALITAATQLSNQKRLKLFWNWKTAAVSVGLRAALFFFTNRSAGQAAALRATLVEAAWATFAAGILGSATERLRHTRPDALAAVLVWLVLPALAVAAQAVVHHLAGTPHIRAGLIASLVFASVASGLTWFLQRRGYLLARRV